MKPHRILTLSLVSLLLLLSLTACGKNTPTGQNALTLAPKTALPDFVRQASSQVKEAYRFAIANPEVLHQYPCYCGCGAMGHRDNLDCYIKEVRADGSFVFDNHALGCSICVDITRDVMRLMGTGKDAPTIRAYIDSTYSKYGPPTDTDPIKAQGQE